MRKILPALPLLLVPCAALAQTPPIPRIIVTGRGSVMTTPDMVSIGFTARGEGGTSDEAVTRLNANRKAVEDALATLGKGRFAITAGQFSVVEMRDRACDATPYQPRLSAGACAITGYVAMLPVTVRTDDVANAGTAVSLIGRLGGANARVENFSVKDGKASRGQAMAAALADARAQAEAIAAGANVKLGNVLSVQDGAANDPLQPPLAIRMNAAIPAPPPPPPPVRVDLKPDPIETQVRVTVVYMIGS